MREIDARSNMFMCGCIQQARSTRGAVRASRIAFDGRRLWDFCRPRSGTALAHNARLVFDMTEGQRSERLNDLQVHGLPVELPGSRRLSSQLTLTSGEGA
jgi:hypothetical protein